MSQITVEDTFLIEGRGLIASGKPNDERHGFRAGARVRITRPDGSQLLSVVRGVNVSRPCFTEEVSIDVLLEGISTREEVPRGSVVTLEVG